MTTIDPNIAIGQLKNIHREFRTALLNKKYYGCRLNWYQNVNRWFEIFIALGAAAGTGIAGFAIWKNGPAVTAWAIISAPSIVPPALNHIVVLPHNMYQ